MIKSKSKALRLSVLYTASALALVAHGASYAQVQEPVQAEAQVVQFNIPAQPLGQALAELGEQADIFIFAPADQTRGKTSTRVSGAMTPSAALAIMLRGTGLEASAQADGSFAIAQAGASSREAEAELAQDEAVRSTPPTLTELRDREAIEADEEVAREGRGLAEFATIDTIVVRGRNVGVRRFEDDPQPYVIFNSDDIENSLATNLEDFLRTRLPQNTQPGSARQFQASFDESPGNVSTIDLRGLGQEETLILVNGRRAPRVSLGNNFRQADINGIPIGSIERIEILPSTASGIYGGGATGGVINIITRRNYVGGEILAEYSNTFDTDVAQRRLTGTYGFSLEGGRTNVQFSASYSDSNELLVGDRDFAQKSRDLLARNDPDFFISGQGTTPNIRDRRGNNLVLDDGTDLGSSRTFIPFGYEGVASDGGAALVQNAGQVNLELPEGVLGKGARLIQAPTTESFSFSITRDFSSTFDVYFDASFSANDGESVSPSLPTNITLRASDPGNPFQNDIAVIFVNPDPDTFLTEISSDSTQLVGGFNWQFAERWTANLDYNWSLSSFESRSSAIPFNTSSSTDPERIGVIGAVRVGELDIFRDLNAFPLDLSPFQYDVPPSIQLPRENEATNLALRISGSAFDLPAGAVNFSFLAERRESLIKGSFTNSIRFGSPAPGTREIVYTPPREQTVDSLYAEALIPVFSDSFSFPFLQELDLQASIRYDAYDTASPDLRASAVLDSFDDPIPEFDAAANSFDSVDYTIGFRFKPVEDVLLRGSFATGFVPPNVTQIFPLIRENGRIFASDPRRPGTRFFRVPTITQGGREDLRPEESESWSLG